jgi:hypothetical protein
VSSQFKITTWEGYDTMQLRTATSMMFLDTEDVRKLREHFEKERTKK